MATIVIHLPSTDSTSRRHPAACPKCGDFRLQRWGKSRKSVTDTQHKNIDTQRWRCRSCAATFRCYPEGIDKTGQTRRLRHLAALLLACGLSSPAVVEIFRNVGITVSRATIWRDRQNEAFDNVRPLQGLRAIPAMELGRQAEQRRVGSALRLKLGDEKPIAIATVPLEQWEPLVSLVQSLPLGLDLDIRVVPE